MCSAQSSSRHVKQQRAVPAHIQNLLHSATFWRSLAFCVKLLQVASFVSVSEQLARADYSDTTQLRAPCSRSAASTIPWTPTLITRLRSTTLQSATSVSPFNALRSELQRSACLLLRLLPSWTLASVLHVWAATPVHRAGSLGAGLVLATFLPAVAIQKQCLTYSKCSK